MSKFRTKLISEEIDSTYARIAVPFKYESNLLRCVINVPVGFVCDYESVPIVKGTSKRGGVIHDYLCRKDSVPVVTKKIAADVYLEAMECRDKNNPNQSWFARLNRFIRRNIKYQAVLYAWRYFHKLNVMSSYEEVMNGQ